MSREEASTDPCSMLLWKRSCRRKCGSVRFAMPDTTANRERGWLLGFDCDSAADLHWQEAGVLHKLLKKRLVFALEASACPLANVAKGGDSGFRLAILHGKLGRAVHLTIDLAPMLHAFTAYSFNLLSSAKFPCFHNVHMKLAAEPKQNIDKLTPAVYCLRQTQLHRIALMRVFGR